MIEKLEEFRTVVVDWQGNIPVGEQVTTQDSLELTRKINEIIDAVNKLKGGVEVLRYSDKKKFHVCDKMPEGSVIELCEQCVTKPAEWVYFRGSISMYNINNCPYCGEELK